MPLPILVDMDGVLVDFHHSFLRDFQIRFPFGPKLEFKDLHSFELEDVYPSEYEDGVWAIMKMPGFFRSMKPKEGALEALNDMKEYCAERGQDVFLCTSPFSTNYGCGKEKIEWVDEHLGHIWTKKLIITKDKTLVQGSNLIDDKPEIVGVCQPVWTHVIFDAPYNKNVLLKGNMKRLPSWSQWKEVLFT